jgi:hypothetical protein
MHDTQHNTIFPEAKAGMALTSAGKGPTSSHVENAQEINRTFIVNLQSDPRFLADGHRLRSPGRTGWSGQERQH